MCIKSKYIVKPNERNTENLKVKRKTFNSEMSYARREGHRQGLEEGIEQKKMYNVPISILQKFIKYSF